MAYALHAGSTPFATPSHSLAGSSPGHPSPFAHTPLQPRTSNVPMFGNYDPFVANNGDSQQVSSSPKSTEHSSLAGRSAGKGHRYNAYNRENLTHRPLNSSPLAFSSSAHKTPGRHRRDDDMDEEDDAYSEHQPSSPLGRVSFPSSSVSGGASSSTARSASNYSFKMGSSSVASNRRQIVLGDDDDIDDVVNPSPLLQRRRGQYKATGPTAFSSRRRYAKTPAFSSPTSSPPIAALFENPRAVDPEEDSRKALLRQRFKKQYFANATKAREEAVKARRKRIDTHGKGKGPAESDDEMDASGDECDEAIMNDELFGRMMRNIQRKEQHALRLSYAREVGDSFDPDMEDVSRWEEELSGNPLPPTTWNPEAGPASSPTKAPSEFDEEEFPVLDDDELEALAAEYAEEFATNAAAAQEQGVDDVLAGLEDLTEEQLFGAWDWNSDTEADEPAPSKQGDVDMDMS